MRRAARIDENQPAIVQALRDVGASVQPLHAVGKGCPDLLVGWRGTNYLVEIKNPAKPRADRQLTSDQVEWKYRWCGTVHLVESIEQALALLKGEHAHQART